MSFTIFKTHCHPVDLYFLELFEQRWMWFSLMSFFSPLISFSLISRYFCFAENLHMFHVYCETLGEQVSVLIMVTHWSWDKMDTILRMAFSNAFYWMKVFLFWFEFHWHLFPTVQLTVNQHWFRYWLCVKQATSHCLKQWWPNLLKLIYVTLPLLNYSEENYICIWVNIGSGIGFLLDGTKP